MSPDFIAGLAVALCGALLLAVGSELQSRAVFAAGGKWRTFLAAPRWYAGLALLGSAVATNFIALALAPVSVVQSVSIVALTVSAAFSGLTGRAHIRARDVGAITLCVAGIVGFILVMHSSLTEMPTPAPITALRTVTFFLAAATGLAFLALATGTRAQRPTVASFLALLAATITFGCITTVFKTLVTLVLESGFMALRAPWPVLALSVVALGSLAANILLQRSHNLFPTPVVVAALTIVDPLTAATIGIAVLGEATLTPASLVALIAFGATACLGVIGVSRIRRVTPGPTPIARFGTNTH